VASAKPDFDETRAGMRSGEGAESAYQQLIASRRRRQLRQDPTLPLPTPAPKQPPADDTGNMLDIDLPL
jgi:hypothetical protein